MRTRTFILCLLALCLANPRLTQSPVPGRIFRVNARFLTDRMAFELHLNSNQYNDLYEINYDFLCNIGSSTFSGIAVADTRHGCILPLPGRTKRRPAMGTFTSRIRTLHRYRIFLPPHLCHQQRMLSARVYKIYPNTIHFYFGPPRHYLTYR